MVTVGDGQILYPPDVHGLKQRLSSIIGMMNMQTYLSEIELIRIAQVDPLGSAVESDTKKELRASLSEFCTEMHKLALKCEISASVAEEYLFRRTVLSRDDFAGNANIVDRDLAMSALETSADICFHSSNFGIMDLYVNVIGAQPPEPTTAHSSPSGSVRLPPKKMWMKRYEEDAQREQQLLENEDNGTFNEERVAAYGESIAAQREEEVVTEEVVDNTLDTVLPPLPQEQVVYEHVVEEEGPYSTPAEWNEVVEDPSQHSITCETTGRERDSSGDAAEEQAVFQQKLETSVDMVRKNERMRLKEDARSGVATTDEQLDLELPQNAEDKPFVVSDGPSQIDNPASKFNREAKSLSFPKTQEEHEAAVAPLGNGEAIVEEAAPEQFPLSPSVEIVAVVPPPPPRHHRRDRSSSNNEILAEIPLPPPAPSPEPVPYYARGPEQDQRHQRTISHHVETPRVVELLSDDDEPVGERIITHYRSPPRLPPEDYPPRHFDDYTPRHPRHHHPGIPRDHRDMPHHHQYMHSPRVPPLIGTYPSPNLPFWPGYHPPASYPMPFDHGPPMYHHHPHHHTPPLFGPHHEYDQYPPFPKPPRIRNRGRRHHGDSDDRDKKKKRFRPDGKQ